MNEFIKNHEAVVYGIGAVIATTLEVAWLYFLISIIKKFVFALIR